MTTSHDESLDLDALDLRLLSQLQVDASLTNQDLAKAVNASPATCLRRVRRLVQTGAIEKTVAVLAPSKVGQALTAIVEVTLVSQDAESLSRFERLVQWESAVQQCYRVSTGPDFVLIITVTNMPAYHDLVHRTLTAANQVRNVRTFFSINRSKFSAQLPLPRSVSVPLSESNRGER
jgi:Lrp/AsnC family transcriptional regulator, leucine-responsive regulatory protein